MKIFIKLVYCFVMLQLIFSFVFSLDFKQERVREKYNYHWMKTSIDIVMRIRSRELLLYRLILLLLPVLLFQIIIREIQAVLLFSNCILCTVKYPMNIHLNNKFYIFICKKINIKIAAKKHQAFLYIKKHMFVTFSISEGQIK